MTVRARDDELGDHRVERARDGVALDHTRVDAHTRTAREAQRRDPARCGQEVRGRVLAVDAELQGVPARDDLVVPERLTRGDPQLLAHQVDAGDLLGDRVLDLQARVDLEERDRAVRADEELARACALVPGLAQDRLAGLDELRALRVGQERRRCLLDELLVTALQRAVTRADDDDGAVRVRQALGLDVPRLVQVPLDEALATTERRDGLAHRGLVHLVDLVRRARHLQPATATAEGRLDRHRKAVLGDERVDLLGTRDRVRRPGDQRGPGALRDVARAHLVAERLDRVRRRTDPREARADHRAREVRVLRQEAVAGVHRVGARARRDVQELVDREVGVRRACAVERVRLVGQRHVQGRAVLVGVDGDGRDARVAACASDADGDLASVGDEDLAQAQTGGRQAGGHGSP